jgi:3-phosphoglycerate kinase
VAARKPKKAKRHLGIHLPQEVGVLLDALISEAQEEMAKVLPGQKVSDTGFVVALIIEKAEQKGIRKK